MITNFNKYLVDFRSPIKKTIKKINKLGGQSLIVVKNKIFFEGILSYYDLRKAITNGKILEDNISKIYNKKPVFIYSDELNKFYLKYAAKANKLKVIPVIEKRNKKVLGLLTPQIIDKLKKKNLKKLGATVVIMAGGEGVRLRPYTSVLPKPLLPIKDKPVIQHIIDQFNKHGKNKFLITLNYKSTILKTFFNDFKKKEKEIELIHEKKPLGTFGGVINLKNKIKKNFFLTNCDTIIMHNYNEILKSHISHKSDITIVVTKKNFQIPYGVTKKADNKIYFEEKPTYNFNVSTGFYIISKKCLTFFRKKNYFDFDDFLKICMNKNMKIHLYKIRPNEWIDVGNLEKYKLYLDQKI